MQNNFTSALKDWRPEELLGAYNKPLDAQKFTSKGFQALMSNVGGKALGAFSVMPKVYQEHKAIKTLGQDIGVLHSLLGNNPAINQLKQK